MANRKIDDVVTHDARACIRLTTEEHARLKAEADAHGVTLSQLIRSRVTGTRIASKIDSQIVADLRRLGMVLNQLLREPASCIDRTKVESTLSEICSAIRRISK